MYIIFHGYQRIANEESWLLVGKFEPSTSEHKRHDLIHLTTAAEICTLQLRWTKVEVWLGHGRADISWHNISQCPEVVIGWSGRQTLENQDFIDCGPQYTDCQLYLTEDNTGQQAIPIIR